MQKLKPDSSAINLPLEDLPNQLIHCCKRRYSKIKTDDKYSFRELGNLKLEQDSRKIPNHLNLSESEVLIFL